MAVKRVGIKEFKDRATQLLAGGEPMVIERHGKPIGFYTPIKRPDPERVREAAARLDARMEELAKRLGVSVEELEDMMFSDAR